MSKQKEEILSTFAKFRNRISKKIDNLKGKFSPNQRFWLGFVLLCLITTLLINNPVWQNEPMPYKVGDIARESIFSPADIHYTDEEATELNRNTAKDSIPPTFTLETRRADEAIQSFRSAWEKLNRSAIGNESANKQNGTPHKSSVEWTGSGGAELGKVFASRRFTSNEFDTLNRILRDNASGDIYQDQDRQFMEGEILVIDRLKPTDARQVQKPLVTMSSVSERRSGLTDSINGITSLSKPEAEAFVAALSPLIQPSVLYDASATEGAKKAVTENIQPVAISLGRGERIVDIGQRIEAQDLSKLAAVSNYAASTRKLNRFFGLLVLISALFWTAWKFIEHRGVVPRLALSEQKTFALFGFIILSQTLIVAIFFRIAEFTATQNVRPPLNDPTLWAFAIPFAFGSLLMTLLADRRTALFTGIFNALIAGLIAPRGLEFVIYATIASAVSVYGIGAYRNRQTVTIAGALVGLTSAAVAIAIIAYSQQPFILNTVGLALACGLASGIVTSAITAMFLPLCESLFGILTDVKLLELSNADLPILGQLALRAPGTNQHSHAVGQLAEDACRVVGGNALLARIGALYHDIGKTAAPEHFIENQMAKNPHDKLRPAQSAKIIISHVTYGAKLAKEIGLPSRIIDFIYQHHGTRTLHYFLKKAQDDARSEEEFNENDFRYPGPKPQFKESAIMMIADSCEAGARSLSEPTPDNIRFIVTKIIDAILTDDQLDECDLTLRELTQIRESIIRSLVAIYHSRVDYPGYTPPPSSANFLIPQGMLEQADNGIKFQNPHDIPISPGGEVEDEAIDRSKTPEHPASN